MTRLFEDWSVISSSSEYEDELASTASTNVLETEEDESDQIAPAEEEPTTASATTASETNTATPSNTLASSTTTLKLPIINLSDNSFGSLDETSSSSSFSELITPESGDEATSTSLAESNSVDENSNVGLDSDLDSPSESRNLCPYVALSRLAPVVTQSASNLIKPVNEDITRASATLHNRLMSNLTAIKSRLSHDSKSTLTHDYVIISSHEVKDEIQEEIIKEYDEVPENSSNNTLIQLWDEYILRPWVNIFLSILDKVQPQNLIYILFSMLLIVVLTPVLSSLMSGIASHNSSPNPPSFRDSATSPIVPSASSTTAKPVQVNSINSFYHQMREKWNFKSCTRQQAVKFDESYKEWICRALNKGPTVETLKTHPSSAKQGTLKLGHAPSKTLTKKSVKKSVKAKWTKRCCQRSNIALNDKKHCGKLCSEYARKGFCSQDSRNFKSNFLLNWKYAEVLSTRWIDEALKATKIFSSHTKDMSTKGYYWAKSRGGKDMVYTKEATKKLLSRGKKVSESWVKQGEIRLQKFLVFTKKSHQQWRNKGWPYSKQRIFSVAGKWFNAARKDLEDASVCAYSNWENIIAPRLKHLWQTSKDGAKAAMSGLTKASKSGTQQVETGLKKVFAIAKKADEDWRTNGWPYSKERMSSMLSAGKNGLKASTSAANTMWSDTVIPNLKHLLKLSEDGAQVAMNRLKLTWTYSRAFASVLLHDAAIVADDIISSSSKR